MTDEKLNEINEETVDNEKPSAATSEEVKETVEETVCAAVNETIEAVEEVKEEIKEVAEPINEKIEEAVIEPVTEKVAEFAEEAVEKTEEVKEAAEEIKEEVIEAVQANAEKAEETAAEAVEITENKVEEAKETVEDAFKLTTIVPDEEKTIADKIEEKISEAKEVKPEVKPQPKTEPVLGEAKRPTITVNTPKEEQDLQKELERMRRDYRRAQREVNELVAQSNRKKSLSNFLLALLAFLTIGLSVGGSYLVTTLNNNKKNDEEKLIVYEGVETNTNSNVNVSTDTSATGKDLTEIVAKIEDCVVEVYTESVSYSAFYGEYVTGGAGSGVIYTSDGYIITNNHVIENARSINVKLHDGTEYSAVLVATDEDTDLAVIKIKATGLKQAVLGDSEKLKVGEGAIAIGNPLGTLGGTVTTGIVSALSREITIENKKMTLLQTNTAISPGNSGGGLFNTSGELIGIVNAKSSGDNVEGIGFAIPVNVVKAVIRDLITNGYVTGRPSIGIKCVSIDNQRYMMYYNVSDYGVYVSEVTSQNAITGGLQSGDLIVAINGKTITSYTDMKSTLADYKPGDVVTLTVLRGRNNRVDLDVALIEKNAVAN